LLSLKILRQVAKSEHPYSGHLHYISYNQPTRSSFYITIVILKALQV